MAPDQSGSSRRERRLMGFVVLLLVVVATVEVAAVMSIHGRLGVLSDDLQAVHGLLVAQGEELEAARTQIESLRTALVEVHAQTPDGPQATTHSAPSTWEGLVSDQDGESRVVDASVLGDMREALDQAMRKVRVVPHTGDDGDYDGFRLAALRRGTLLAALGIRNGDVVHAINGYPLTSGDEAMQAFGALYESSEFHLEITRRGESMELRYLVR